MRSNASSDYSSRSRCHQLELSLSDPSGMGPYFLDFKNPYKAHCMGTRLVGMMTTYAEWLSIATSRSMAARVQRRERSEIRAPGKDIVSVGRNESQQGYNDDRGREAEMGQRSTHQ
jgi:hypothetical protein